MHDYGTTSEQLAQIAVSFREWAVKNPNAYHQEPITIDDVLASPLVAAPLPKLDCCLVTDGAGALVVTSAERARDLARPPVYVLGAGTAQPHGMSLSPMGHRSEGHTSVLQTLLRISSTVCCTQNTTTDK